MKHLLSVTVVTWHHVPWPNSIADLGTFFRPTKKAILAITWLTPAKPLYGFSHWSIDHVWWRISNHHLVPPKLSRRCLPNGNQHTPLLLITPTTWPRTQFSLGSSWPWGHLDSKTWWKSQSEKLSSWSLVRPQRTWLSRGDRGRTTGHLPANREHLLLNIISRHCGSCV